jgi:hypothetical protein
VDSPSKPSDVVVLTAETVVEAMTVKHFLLIYS